MDSPRWASYGSGESGLVGPAGEGSLVSLNGVAHRFALLLVGLLVAQRP